MVCTPAGTRLSELQLQHIVNHVCKGAILIETEAAAIHYRTTVRHNRRRCPAIVCRDTGSLLTAAGSLTIGKVATAPANFNGLRVCLGAPARETTGAYRAFRAALASLACMPEKTQQLRTAKVCSRTARKHCDHLFFATEGMPGSCHNKVVLLLRIVGSSLQNAFCLSKLMDLWRVPLLSPKQCSAKT